MPMTLLATEYWSIGVLEYWSIGVLVSNGKEIASPSGLTQSVSQPTPCLVPIQPCGYAFESGAIRGRFAAAIGYFLIANVLRSRSYENKQELITKEKVVRSAVLCLYRFSPPSGSNRSTDCITKDGASIRFCP